MSHISLRSLADTLRRSIFAAVLAAPVMLVVGCTAPADETTEEAEGAIGGREFAAGAILRVTANQLNVRSKAGTSNRIIAVVKRDDLVTVVERSSTGWVNIRTADGVEGWAARAYLLEEEDNEGDDPDGNSDTSARNGDSCDPSRGADVVNRYQKALHDTIAHAEGTRDHSKDGYDTLFGHGTYASCMQHPDRCIRYGSTCSTAAGRYQFLNGTWRSIANARGYATFEPENQERGAEYLVKSVRRASIPTDRPLTSAEFSNTMSKLSYEWASLPPGRYGQPKKSLSELRGVYCSILGC